MSHFISFSTEVHKIRKAATPRRSWRSTRTYKRLFHLSKAMSNGIRLDLLRGLTTFKNKVSPNAVYQAWLRRDAGRIMETVPWKDLDSHLEGYGHRLGRGIDETAKIALNTLPPPIEKRLRWDTSNPALRDYVRQRTGELVVNITQESQALIQNAVVRSFDDALTPKQVANLIRGGIGLYPQQEQSLRNYTSMLANTGIGEERALVLSEKYAARLLNQRSETIARTEIRRVSNFTQLDVWQTAQNQGLVSTTARKVWIVDGNPCEICLPMDGKSVELQDAWILGNGEQVDIPSDSHPNCYCGMELDFGETKAEHEAAEPEDYQE